MIKTLNIRLYPTRAERLMYNHIGCMRFVYNWGLAKQIENFKNWQGLTATDLGRN